MKSDFTAACAEVCVLFICSTSRVKIVKEKALPEIENYMFEDHEQIRQAATECMCNLVTCKEVGTDKLLKSHIVTDDA